MLGPCLATGNSFECDVLLVSFSVLRPADKVGKPVGCRAPMGTDVTQQIDPSLNDRASSPHASGLRHRGAP